jgi:O-antigen ligase
MKRPWQITAAGVIEAVLFYALLAVIVLVAIPYGTVEPWWKALFQCAIFFFSGLAIIQKWLSSTTSVQSLTALQSPGSGVALLFPVLALVVFALGQTIPWSSYTIGGDTLPKTLSADPYETRLVVIQLCALVLMGWLLVRYTSNQRRLYLLTETIIAIAVASAVFGLLRQASQREVGFILPHLRPGFGYGQFINSNHFSFLMEMGLGLALGIAVCRGVRGLRLLFYLLAALPMFVSLVFANSRGGILSMLCQVAFLAVLMVSGRKTEATEGMPGLSRKRVILGRAILVVILLIGGAVTVVFVGGDPLAGRIETIPNELDRKTAETFALRQNIWGATWQLIKEHPIAGVGFGGYWLAISRYHRASGEFTPQEAHNDYLELLASGGVIALAIAVWLVLSFVRLTRGALRVAETADRALILGAVTGMLTVAVHSLVDFGLHITINAVVFTVLSSLVVSVSRQTLGRSSRQEQ